MRKLVVIFTLIASLVFVAAAVALDKEEAQAKMSNLAGTFCRSYEAKANPAWDCIKVTGPNRCYATGHNKPRVPQWDCVDYFDQRSHGADRRCVLSAGIDPYGKIEYAYITSCVLFN